MGRSVSYINNAEYVLYFTFDNDENMDDFRWDDFKDNLKYEIKAKCKSFYECRKWDNNETLIFLENELAEIALSEYCGLYSLSIKAKDDDFNWSDNKTKEGLAKNFVHQIRSRLENALKNCGVKILNRLGTFSNGEAVFELAK